jgi:hypothetical protein
MGGKPAKAKTSNVTSKQNTNGGSNASSEKKIVDVKQAEDAIIKKLKKGNKQANNMPEDELREWARSLCAVKDLQEWYLNPEFAQTEKALEKMEKFGKGKDDDDFEDVDFKIDDLKEELAGERKDQYKIRQTIKVKLVIAEICKSDTQKAIRKMLSPVLTRLDHQQQFGMFHSALVVGPWYLEWNNSSLCIPRKCYSSAAMLAADLDFQTPNNKFDLNKTIQLISEVIIDWNVNKEYTQRKNNCQDFIDEMCEKLGINLNSMFKGPLGEYLKSLRKDGQCDISFPLSADLRQELGIKETSKKFATHEELDVFVNQIVVDKPTFEEDFKEHWLLLKSFDRAFWLRSFKHKEDPKFSPHDCPFKDPTITTSFKTDWF